MPDTPKSLVWDAHSVSSQMNEELHPGFQARPSETTDYLIHDYTVQWLVTFTDRDKRSVTFPSFEVYSEAEAKAACERHHATGKWE